MIIRAFEALTGVHQANAEVRLRIGRDPSLPGEAVLIVEYPEPTGDPAGPGTPGLKARLYR